MAYRLSNKCTKIIAIGQFVLKLSSKMYTMSQKNRACNIIPHNSCKCAPILIIFLPSHSQTNCGKSICNIYHLTSNLLPHYLAKVECSTQQLYCTLFNANVAQNCLFTASVYQKC